MYTLSSDFDLDFSFLRKSKGYISYEYKGVPPTILCLMFFLLKSTERVAIKTQYTLNQKVPHLPFLVTCFINFIPI